ncbi:MAG: hypothetical protein JWN24_2589 [Phycisphaerales bacterium]|nr:hypothetical protein [Phycisphaerales bacterium]
MAAFRRRRKQKAQPGRLCQMRRRLPLPFRAAADDNSAMPRKIKYALLAALAFGVAGAAVFFHPTPLLAADKPKRDPPAEPKARPTDRFGAVRGWMLICTLHSDDNDFAFDDQLVFKQKGGNKHRVSRRDSIVARIKLTEFKDGKGFYEWRGKGDALFEVFEEKYLDSVGTHSHTIMQGSGYKPTEARLHIQRDSGTYQFHITKQSVIGTRFSETKYDDPKTEALIKGMEKNYRNPSTDSLKVDSNLGDAYFQVARDLPTQGLAMGGDSSLPVQEYLKLNPQYDQQHLHVAQAIEGNITWELVPLGEEILVLDVIPQTDYQKWLPRGDLDDAKKAGNKLRFEARLTATDGKPVRSKVNQFFFELEKTSKEPGVCMNWPGPGEATTDFDLKFDWDGASALFPRDDSFQSAMSKPGPQTSVSGSISCYDFGAYGYLKGYVRLEDGRRVYAHLNSDRGRTRVPIPWRENDSSKAATQYKIDGKIPDAKDSDDDEKPLGGHGQTGDGLCVYEEYRGFATINRSGEKPEFARLDPLKKNLFVRDERSNGDSIPLGMYTLITEVEVALVPPAGHRNRVINFNHSGAVPHLCDQHLVLLRTGSSTPKHAGGQNYRIVPENPAKPYYTPADVEAIEDITAHNLMLMGDPSSSEIADAQFDFVRQLLRATGGHYHGDGDADPVYWTIDAKGVLRENGKPIKGFTGADEKSSLPITLRTFPMLPRWIEVAKQKGRYSGVQDCIMRYHDAPAYVSASDSSVRYFLAVQQPEGMSVNLCIGMQGTGVNAPPHPRYGNATYGECKYRIRVSDVK